MSPGLACRQHRTGDGSSQLGRVPVWRLKRPSSSALLSSPSRASPCVRAKSTARRRVPYPRARKSVEAARPSICTAPESPSGPPLSIHGAGPDWWSDIPPYRRRGCAPSRKCRTHRLSQQCTARVHLVRRGPAPGQTQRVCSTKVDWPGAIADGRWAVRTASMGVPCSVNRPTRSREGRSTHRTTRYTPCGAFNAGRSDAPRETCPSVFLAPCERVCGEPGRLGGWRG